MRKGLKGKESPTYIHGESHTRLHNIWMGMLKRCKDGECYEHKRYHDRGIRVCDEWQEYIPFRDWALANGYSDDLSIERKDVDGNYCPENCTWIPMEKQARNRTTTFWIEYNGERISLAEACEREGQDYKIVHWRFRHGWDIYKALYTPIKKVGKSLRQECEERGLNYRTIANRVYSLGWSREDAFSIPIGGKGANQTRYKHVI